MTKKYRITQSSELTSIYGVDETFNESDTIAEPSYANYADHVCFW